MAMVDEKHVVDGAEVHIVLGEEGGGSAKPTVERHVQRTIRATLHTRPAEGQPPVLPEDPTPSVPAGRGSDLPSARSALNFLKGIGAHPHDRTGN